MKKKISVLHPTCRSKKAREIRKKWFLNAKHPDNIEYLTCFDTKDKSLFFRKKEINNNSTEFFHPTSIGIVKKINYLGKKANANCIVMSTDDTIPERNWDEKLITTINWEEEIVVNTRDGSENKEKRDYIIKGVVVSKKRYEKLGYIFHPELEHLFADDFHSWISYRDDVVIERKDIFLEHLHPLVNNDFKEEWDKFYERVNTKEKYEIGGAIFMKLVQDNINTNIIGNLLDEYIVLNNGKKKNNLRFVLESAGVDFEKVEAMEKEGVI